MENITALQLFEQGLTKTQIKSMAEKAVEGVKENGNVLQVAEALSAMELFIKEVKGMDEFKNYAGEEIEKHKVFKSASGAKIELIEAGVTYDYSKCNDTELELLESNLNGAKESLKTRQDFLKNIPIEGIDVVEPYTGEVIHIYPPSKTSTSSYKVSLAK